MTAPGEQSAIPFNAWAFRLAGACACAIFPLIWVGGLVTTYDAGMAVPDWPTTFGINLWLYSWAQWISGPWDLFIEHGHRLLGSLVGMLSIGLVCVCWLRRTSTTVRWLSLALLAAVISQGILGGMRVVLVERDLARIHGCVGPAVFALACVVWACASPTWCHPAELPSPAMQSMSPKRQVRLWPWLLSLGAWLVYGQLVLGSCLRHTPTSLSPAAFRGFVLAHVGLGLFTGWCLLSNGWKVHREFKTMTSPGPEIHRVVRHVRWLAGLVLLQLGLGLATWISKYSWPDWLRWVPGSETYVVRAESVTQSMIVTAHVAMGSLLFALSVVASVWASRAAGWSLHNDPVHENGVSHCQPSR